MAKCANGHQAELVTLSSSEDLDRLIQILQSSTDQIWIGAHDLTEEGMIQWQDGKIQYLIYLFQGIFYTELIFLQF